MNLVCQLAAALIVAASALPMTFAQSFYSSSTTAYEIQSPTDVTSVTVYASNNSVDRNRQFAEQFKAFDRNRDGQLSKQELPSFHRRLFDRIDRTLNGALDQEEWTAGMLRMSNRRGYELPVAAIRPLAFQVPRWTQASYAASYVTMTLGDNSLPATSSSVAGDVALDAKVVYPKAHVPFPLIVVSSSAIDGDPDEQMQIWAQRGYVVMSLTKNGQDMTTLIDRIRHFCAATPQLNSRVEMDRVALIGFNADELAAPVSSDDTRALIYLQVSQLITEADPTGIQALDRLVKNR